MVTGYALVPILVLFFVLTIIYFIYCDCRCGGHKFLVTVIFISSFFSACWLLLFVWLKAEEYVTWNWQAAMSGFWTLCIVLCALFIGFSIFFMLESSTRIKKMYRRLVGVILISYLSFLAWLVFLSLNLERRVYDIYTFSWILVSIPLWVCMGCGILLLCVLSFYAATYEA